MLIKDMPEFKDKKHVLSFDSKASLLDVVSKMAELNYGAALITEKDKLVGIFTERDLLRKVAPNNVDMKKTKIKNVMSTELKTANANDKIADSLYRMSQGRFRHLPIIDDKGKIEGMLSQGDFVALTMSDVFSRITTAAKANVSDGNSTPWSMIAAIVVYTLGLLFIVSAADHWFF